MFAILLGGVARRRLVPLALHLRNEAQHRVVAEYVVVAARADKNLCLGKTEKKKKSKHYFCCCIAVCGASGKTRVSSFRRDRQLLNPLLRLLLGENPGEVDTVF